MRRADDAADVPRSAPLARELTGHLLCVRCGYDLRGLSVLSQCSECGLNVRTTLLAKVDPQADELQPIVFPYLTAIGLLLWPAGALGAITIVWAARARDVVAMLSTSEPVLRWGGHAVALCILISGLGALALVRPHRVQSAWISLAALGAVLLHPPLAWLVQHAMEMDSPMLSKPYLQPDGLSPWRVGFSLVAVGIMALITQGLRASQHLLILRSVLMRTGRTDRQTMPGILAALAMMLIGLALHMGCFWIDGLIRADLVDIPRYIGTIMVAVGSMLFTLGLVGLFIDSVRLWPVVTSNPLSLRDVLGTGRAGGQESP